MLNQPNERINEIGKDRLAKPETADETKGGSFFGRFAALLFVFLLFLLVLGLASGEWGKSFGVSALISLASLIFRSPPGETADGGPKDPTYFMPFIMRMMAEILADEWGAHSFEKERARFMLSFPNRCAALQNDAPVQGGVKTCRITFFREYGRDAEDRYDNRWYTIYLESPFEGCNKTELGYWHLYNSFKQRMDKEYKEPEWRRHRAMLGAGTVWSDDDKIYVRFDLMKFDGGRFSEPEAYDQDAWFRLARELAIHTKRVVNCVEQDMENILAELEGKSADP